LTESAVAFWDQRYQMGNVAVEVAEVPDWLRRGVAFFGPVQGKRVLDIGCGLGESAIALARLGARVTAIDTSAVATRKLAEFARANRLPIEARPLDAMRIAELGRFEFVTGAMILHHLEPFEAFCDVLDAALCPGGKAFFYENNGASRLFMWCRQHLAGRFGIPKYGDREEVPLMPSEVRTLRRRLQVAQEFPENSFFTLLAVYLLKRRGYHLGKRLDAFCLRHNLMRGFSYRQMLLVEKPG